MRIIYINEAHAVDVWPIGESAGALNYSHKVIADRIRCAQEFRTKYDIRIPMYCDSMKDDFETLFAGWPTRYYIAERGLLTHIGQPQDSELDVDRLLEFLSRL